MLKNFWTASGMVTLEQAWPRHRMLLWGIVLTGFLLVSFAGNLNRGLLETTEGRYAECAREMLETGNFLVPTLNYAPHWSKPPMAYWAMAAGMALTGPGEAGARLGSAVAFLCTGLLTTWLAWRLWGELAGFIALGVYSTSVLPILGATFLSSDMVLTLWETLAVVCYIFWTRSEHHSGALVVTMWTAFGLAFLTKGPPGLLPLLAIIPWHIWRFRNMRLLHPGGLILFALLAFGWFGYIMWKHPDLFSYYIKEEVVARLTSDRFHRNPEWYKPLVIFAPVLILGEAHWFWLSGSLKKAWREFPRDQRIFLGLWFALPLAIFCLAKSRLPLYVLPLSIPLTLFLANAIARKRNTVRLRNAGALFLGLVLLVVLTRSLLGLVPMHQNMRQLHADVAGAGEGQIVALLKEKAYGLQFYAAGKVNWIGAKGEQRKDSLRSFLQSASGKFRLVARAKDRPMVEEALRARKTHGSTREMNDWIVVTFVL